MDVSIGMLYSLQGDCNNYEKRTFKFDDWSKLNYLEGDNDGYEEVG